MGRARDRQRKVGRSHVLKVYRMQQRIGYGGGGKACKALPTGRPSL